LVGAAQRVHKDTFSGALVGEGGYLLKKSEEWKETFLDFKEGWTARFEQRRAHAVPALK
jgi:hypothetical protein